MFLKAVDKWKIKMGDTFLLNVDNGIKIIMDNAFWIGISSNGNPASLILASPHIRFIEEIIKRCLNRVIDILED
jgi:hypothetical protein